MKYTILLMNQQKSCAQKSVTVSVSTQSFMGVVTREQDQQLLHPNFWGAASILIPHLTQSRLFRRWSHSQSLDWYW